MPLSALHVLKRVCQRSLAAERKHLISHSESTGGTGADVKEGSEGSDLMVEKSTKAAWSA